MQEEVETGSGGWAWLVDLVKAIDAQNILPLANGFAFLVLLLAFLAFVIKGDSPGFRRFLVGGVLVFVMSAALDTLKWLVPRAPDPDREPVQLTLKAQHGNAVSLLRLPAEYREKNEDIYQNALVVSITEDSPWVYLNIAPAERMIVDLQNSITELLTRRENDIEGPGGLSEIETGG